MVEDDGLIRDLLVKTLSQGSYNLHLDWASDFRNASNYLSTTPPFFLILDLHLPDGNGLELIPIAKEVNPAIKIMAM
ncbi:response regulator, partial [Arthrospira platensis SPKY1]|nr:response regulator [Arthrospira platensis SPKY1]